LYLVDKALILFIALGVGVDVLFFRIWIRPYSRRTIAGWMIALAGVVFWFVKAPDPRFGTGFLLALIYFQYSPFVSNRNGLGTRNFYMMTVWIKNISTLFIIFYIGYRAVYFFRPRQFIFPGGIHYSTLIQPDCDGQMKKMLLDKADIIPQLPDSCMHFMFRGTTIKQGFKPAR